MTSLESPSPTSDLSADTGLAHVHLVDASHTFHFDRRGTNAGNHVPARHRIRRVHARMGGPLTAALEDPDAAR